MQQRSCENLSKRTTQHRTPSTVQLRSDSAQSKVLSQSPAAVSAKATSDRFLLPPSAWPPCVTGTVAFCPCPCPLLLMVTVSPSRKRLRGLLLMTVKPSSSSSRSESAPSRSKASHSCKDNKVSETAVQCCLAQGMITNAPQHSVQKREQNDGWHRR